MRESKRPFWGLGTLTLLAMLALVGAPSPARSGGFCFRAVNQTTYYYSDATYTHLVGQCVTVALCGGHTGCSGTQTSFSKTVQSVPCWVCR
jgi:hypothetical protein